MFPNLSSWVFIYCHPDLGGWTGGRDYKIVATKMELEFFSGLLGDDGEVVAIVHLHLDVLVHLSGNFRLVKHLGVESLNSVGCTVMISPKFFKLSLHKNIVVFILSTKVLFIIFKIPFSLVFWASFFATGRIGIVMQILLKLVVLIGSVMVMMLGLTAP